MYNFIRRKSLFVRGNHSFWVVSFFSNESDILAEIITLNLERCIGALPGSYPWPPDEEWRVEALFIDPTFVKVIVLAQKHALVGGVNDQRILRQP